MKPEPQDILPLSAIAFEVLMTLAEGNCHGYHMMLAVEGRTGAPVHPGTLYRTLARLEEQQVVKELPSRRTDGDERRRHFTLTTFGRQVAQAEARRLVRLVEGARRRQLLPEGDR